jgi:uncharacterized RDD family membrane protein YckC
MELEDRMTLSSAEGIDLHLVLAGISSRTAAAVLDLMLQVVAVLLVSLVASPFGDAGRAIFAVGSFAVLLGYPIVAEAFGGRTLGKAAMGIAVVSSDGTPCTFVAAVVRNVVRLVDALPGVYLVGYISILATRRNQRVGDLAAGTLVVRRGRLQHTVGGPVAFDAGLHPPAGWGGPTGPTPETLGWDVVAVTADEVAAVRSFLVRRGELDPAHRANLAQTLAFQLLPKVAGVPLEGGPEAFLERVVTAKLSR